MNTLLSNATLFELDPLLVYEGKRIGFLHEDKAAAIGRLMKIDGQRDPIKVVKQPKNDAQPWRLVTGMHRLIGARMEAIPVWAIEVAGKTEDLADLEASENLHRRSLEPLERSKLTAALVQAARDRISRENGNLKQQQLAVRARWARVEAYEIKASDALAEEVDDTCRNLQHAYGWEQSVSAALGLSRDDVYRDLRLFRLIVEPFPDLVERLSAHQTIGRNKGKLRAIADLREVDQRRAVIETLLADHDLEIEDAIVRVGLKKAVRKPSKDEKHLAAITGNLSRLTATLQKRYVPEIAAVMKSAEVKRQMRDLLNQQLGDISAIHAAFAAVTSLLGGESVDDDQLAAVAESLRAMIPQTDEQDGQ